MNEIHTRAFGKVMIAGEYSVLFGGLSLLAAVDRFAQASFSKSDHTEFRLHMNGVVSRDDAHPLWIAFLEVASTYECSFASGIYTINTNSFFYDSKKLGLGSSASATVALAKLLLCQHGLDDLNLLHRLSHAAHRRFSEQLGSGADIAVSSFAASLRFSQKDEVFRIDPIDLSPLWSELILIFTGRSQNTRPMVKAALNYAVHHPTSIEIFKESSDRLLAELGKMPQIDRAIAIFDELATLLGDFGERAGVDIMSREHQEIRRIAGFFGGSAKPSGAGGGDISLALVPKSERCEFKRLISAAGFSVVPLGLA